MNTARVVLDTNIIISALLFGGKPRTMLKLVVTKRIIALSSPPLLAELLDVLAKKFSFPKKALKIVEQKIKKSFKIVHPAKAIHVLNSPDDRVLEAALEGNYDYIITGDKELLELRSFHNIKVVNAHQFLNFFNTWML